MTKNRQTWSCAKTRMGYHGCIRVMKLHWMATATCGVSCLCQYPGIWCLNTILCSRWENQGATENLVIDRLDYTPIQDIIIRGGENLFPVQIENALTSNLCIVEAAAVSVPDKRYGEVVGAWIKLKDGVTLTRESVRKIVWENMNPQVRDPVDLGASCDCLRRMHQRGYGSLGRMARRMSSRRRRVGRCRNIF